MSVGQENMTRMPITWGWNILTHPSCHTVSLPNATEHWRSESLQRTPPSSWDKRDQCSSFYASSFSLAVLLFFPYVNRLPQAAVTSVKSATYIQVLDCFCFHKMTLAVFDWIIYILVPWYNSMKATLFPFTFKFLVDSSLYLLLTQWCQGPGLEGHWK